CSNSYILLSSARRPSLPSPSPYTTALPIFCRRCRRPRSSSTHKGGPSPPGPWGRNDTSRRSAPARSSFASDRPEPERRIWRSPRSEEHTSELQSREYLVCRLLLEKKKRHKL